LEIGNPLLHWMSPARVTKSLLVAAATALHASLMRRSIASTSRLF